MTHRLFADTSGFLAGYSASDARHGAATAALSQRTVLITSRLIVIETVSLLTKRLSPFHARTWYASLAQATAVQIREFDPALYSRSEKLWMRHRDKDWDLIDCYSFCLMRKEKLTRAWTFDHHYRQAGFTTLV